MKAVGELQDIFNENKGKRICVVGGSCVGKSTLLKHLSDAIDMDDLLFGDAEKGLEPLLSQEEVTYVMNPEWSPEIGEFMKKRAKELITITPSNPVFGTIVFDSDLIIEIVVPDDEYKRRIQERGANEESVYAMKKQIEEEITSSGIPSIQVENI